MSPQCPQRERFLTHKTYFIAKLKLWNDITEQKKTKKEKTRTDDSREKELPSEISKQFTSTKFVENVLEIGYTVNIIPA